MNSSRRADLTVRRSHYSDCTTSRVFSPHFKKFIALLELPWLGNSREVSCIPDGVYPYRVAPSNRLNGRMVIWIDSVPGRSNIQIHPANYTRQLMGCGAPGYSIVDMDGDGILDVARSSDAHDFLLANIPSTGHIRFIENKKPVGVFSDED